MLTDAEIAKLPPYKKLLKFSKDNGACIDFLHRAGKCNSYREAIEKQNINLIKWFDWLSEYFTDATWAEYEKATGPALAEYEKVTDAALAEYKKVTDAALAEYEKVTAPALAEYEKIRAPALIQGVISVFN